MGKRPCRAYVTKRRGFGCATCGQGQLEHFLSERTRRARQAAQHLPGEIVALIKQHRELRRLWYIVRLRCTDPTCAGYFVVRKRWGGKYRFAGCSTWLDARCRETMGSVEYARRKALTCIALWAGENPEHPYLIRASGLRKKATAPR